MNKMGIIVAYNILTIYLISINVRKLRIPKSIENNLQILNNILHSFIRSNFEWKQVNNSS